MSVTKASFLFTLFLSIQSCGILYKNKSPKTISIVIDSTKAINYGTPIPFDVIATYSKGKTKNITRFKGLELISEKGELKKSKLVPEALPNSFEYSSVGLKAFLTTKSTLISDSITVNYNYKSNIELDFSGENGQNGKKGKKGSLNFLTRSGTDGTIGQDGENGAEGHDILIHIWKSNQMYFIRVNDLLTDLTYYYKIKPTAYKLKLDVSGGNGGDGGNGGAGADGKDAEVKNGKQKPAGSGGAGGNGGNGGIGGGPGDVYVYLHPTASDFREFIVIKQSIGRPGKLGLGNSGGKAGKVLNANEQAIDGENGFDGIEGFQNERNNIISIEIQDFNSDHFQPNN